MGVLMFDDDDDDDDSDHLDLLDPEEADTLRSELTDYLGSLMRMRGLKGSNVAKLFSPSKPASSPAAPAPATVAPAVRVPVAAPAAKPATPPAKPAAAAVEGRI